MTEEADRERKAWPGTERWPGQPSGARPNRRPGGAGRAARRRRRLVAWRSSPRVLVVIAGSSSPGPGRPPPPARPSRHPDWSVARRWDEALLDAIRRALPNPPLHARNLFHISAAMWDAWAAYDPTARGYFVTEKHQAGDVAAARDEAISYAAYRVLTERYIKSVGGVGLAVRVRRRHGRAVLPAGRDDDRGRLPGRGRATGSRRPSSRTARTDGSNEDGGYAATDYKPVNPPLVVAESGHDHDRPEPLAAAPDRAHDLPERHPGDQRRPAGGRPALGPRHGFALPAGGAAGMPIDPGPPPRLGDPATDQAFKDQAVEVIRDSSLLDPADGATIDISPGALGDNSLGTNDGRGTPVNPATGQPYPPDVVNQGDFGRVMAEFWADGPSRRPRRATGTCWPTSSRTSWPPICGSGAPVRSVDRLEWDVKLYLALNGAVHDAAIAAWGLKGHYDSVRPISLIRYMGGLGQSSDPALPSYDPEGLPLVPGLVEVITSETTAPGQRHAALAGHEGEIAVRAWAGHPGGPEDADRRRRPGSWPRTGSRTSCPPS